MEEPPPSGPEARTLIERMILGLRLPYPVGAFVFAMLVPGARLLFYLTETADLTQALDATFGQPENVSQPQWLAILALQVAVPSYAYWVIHYMRRKFAAGERDLSPLIAEGWTAYRETSARLSRSGPSVLFGGLLLGPGLLLSPPPKNLLEVVIFLPPTAILFLAYGTAGWVYFSALAGLNKLVAKPLNLRPAYEDPMLGTRALGTLCLSLGAAFFGLMALLTAQFPLAPTPDAPSLFLFNVTAIGIPVSAGAVAFLLPLRAVHDQLVRAREKEQAIVRSRIGEAWNPCTPKARPPQSRALPTSMASSQRTSPNGGLRGFPTGPSTLRSSESSRSRP